MDSFENFRRGHASSKCLLTNLASMATLAEALALLDVVAGRKTFQRPPAATLAKRSNFLVSVHRTGELQQTDMVKPETPGVLSSRQ